MTALEYLESITAGTTMTAPKALEQAHKAASHLATPVQYPDGPAPYFELEGDSVPWGAVTQLGETLSVELHGLSAEMVCSLLGCLRIFPLSEAFKDFAVKRLSQPPVRVDVQNDPNVSGE